MHYPLEIVYGFFLYAAERLRRFYLHVYYAFFDRRENAGRVKIILADWGGYALLRQKRFKTGTLRCGLGRLLEKIAGKRPGLKFEVVLVINDCPAEKKNSYETLKGAYGFIETVLFRSNAGRDFGAYNAGLRYLRQTGYDGDLIFMNSSAVGPEGDFWLRRYHDLFHHAKDIGLCGVSLNSAGSHLSSPKFLPHVQGYFIYTSMTVLAKVFKDGLPGSEIDPADKARVISEAEIALSQAVLDAGLGLCSSFYGGKVYRKGQSWRYPVNDLRQKPWYRYLINRI